MTTASLTRLPPGESRTVAAPELEGAAGSPPPGADPDDYRRAWLRHHGLVVVSGDAETTTVRLTRRFALEGAAVLGLLAAVVAFVGRPVYGVVTALLVVAACAVLAALWPTIAARAPRVLPRGRLLGAAAVLPALVVAGVIVAVLRHQHIADSAHDAAVRDIRDANTALDENNPKLAIQLLARAESEDPDVRGAQTVRARLVIAQSSGRIRALEAEVRRLKAELARAR